MASIDKYIIKKLFISLVIVCIAMLSLAWLTQVLRMLDEASFEEQVFQYF